MQDLADLAAWRVTLMIHERGFIFSQRRKERKGIPTECWTWRLGERWFTQEDLFSRKGAKNAKDSYGMLDLADLAAWREMVHARDLFSRKGAKNAKDSYGVPNLPDLAAWRVTLMIHARGFIFSQRRGGCKEFLRNVGLGGPGGLARDFNDSRTRIYFLAKARRTQ